MAETDDDDAFFLGEDGLIHCPTRVQANLNDDDDEVSGNGPGPGPPTSRDFCSSQPAWFSNLIRAMINIPTKILSSIILSLTFPVLILSQNENYYNLCSPFKCGDITFPFPFSDQSTFGSSGPINCGIPGYQITCDQQESSPVPKLMLSGRLYQVKNIFLNLNQTNNQEGWNLITLVDSDLIRDFDSNSCQSLRNLTIPVYANSDALGLLPNWTNTNLTFARCPSQLKPSQEFLDQISSDYSCNDDGNRLYLWRNDIEPPLFDVMPTECKLFMVPASTADVLIMFKNTSVALAGRNVEWSQLTKTLAAGFPLQWNTSNECASCQMKGGHCGFDGTKVVCFCRDSPDCNSTK
ncbi:hypothetical protein COLO4_33045 [Corchorus olitorius]|uniref:non-specific serine/threonine protein kinase n=1 Tax=Corchorus olitorius TaxID=93759 RepID=A0A1R3GWR1_9ROSI|nr:hypothetical protein COLO4_33045 [Corchorus olitorius]